MNGDNPDARNTLVKITTANWERLLDRREILVSDEAQRIENIGMAMKLVTDELPDVQVIASGTSSFELMN